MPESIDLSKFEPTQKTIQAGEERKKQESAKNKKLALLILACIVFLSIVTALMLSKEKKAESPYINKEYTPPANYKLSPGEKYTPSFP